MDVEKVRCQQRSNFRVLGLDCANLGQHQLSSNKLWSTRSQHFIKVASYLSTFFWSSARHHLSLVPDYLWGLKYAFVTNLVADCTKFEPLTPQNLSAKQNLGGQPHKICEVSRQICEKNLTSAPIKSQPGRACLVEPQSTPP